jgi:hypothetical protein
MQSEQLQHADHSNVSIGSRWEDLMYVGTRVWALE